MPATLGFDYCSTDFTVEFICKIAYSDLDIIICVWRFDKQNAYSDFDIKIIADQLRR